MTIKTVYAADITKSYRDDNGDLVVEGIATSADLDLDRQICDPEWLKSAMPDWFEWGNIRAQHSELPAGHAVDMQHLPGDRWWIKALITEPTAADMAEKGTYKGFSIGIKDPAIYRDSAAKSLGASGGRIAGGVIVHVGMVDRPCNPISKLSLAKSAAPGMTVKAADLDRDRMLLKVFEVEEHPENAELPGDPAEVRKAADKPADGADADVMAAQDLGAAERNAAQDVVAELKSLLPTLTKSTSDEDIASAQEAIAIIGRIIVSEAESLAAGNLSDACDIDELLCAVRALKWFMMMESEEDIDDAMVTIGLADLPDTTKTPASADTARKTAGADLTELVKAAVTEAMAGSEERIKALAADLAKVQALPAPGGPVLTRTAQDTQKAATKDALLAKAAHFRQLADAVTDPAARQGYLAMAADAEQLV